jgi:FG-GAP-like repeat/Cep192 domain 4
MRSREKHNPCRAAAVAALTLSLAGFGAAAQAPVPLVNQPLMPMVATPGATGLTLKVSGTGFVSGSKVKWNGTVLTTSFISKSQLTALVPAANIATAGAAMVTVAQPVGRGGISNVSFLEISQPISSIALNRADYAVGSGSDCIAAADFNGDGVPDLAVASASPAQVSILIGNSDGTFQPAANYSVPSAPGCLVAGDFNNDGKADLAVTGSDAIYVFSGQGDGTFGLPFTFVVNASSGPIVAADFNGDGTLDFAASNSLGNNIVVIVNGQETDYAVGNTPEGIAVGDFNRDGKLDLAVANFQDSTISILSGNGDGTFQPAVNVAAPNGPFAVVTADFNADNKLDLAVASPGFSQTTNVVAFLAGNGNGTFKPPVNYNVSGSPVALVAGDFNDDGSLDLAAANQGSNAVSLLLGNGHGNFLKAADYPAAAGTTALAAGDFNRDGGLDLAASYSNGSVASVFLEGATGVPGAAVSPTSILFPLTVVTFSSSSVPVTLTNTGTGNLNISSITATTQFTQTNDCGSTLVPGAACTINVVFSPQHQGTQTGTLSINDNASGSPQTVALSGQGCFFVVTPGSLSFGTVPVGSTSASQVITIYGEDSTPEKVSFSISPTADALLFPYTDTCNGFVPSHASCAVTMSFAPQAVGTISATFLISGGGGITRVPISGTGQ